MQDPERDIIEVVRCLLSGRFLPKTPFFPVTGRQILILDSCSQHLHTPSSSVATAGSISEREKVCQERFPFLCLTFQIDHSPILLHVSTPGCFAGY